MKTYHTYSFQDLQFRFVRIMSVDGFQDRFPLIVMIDNHNDWGIVDKGKIHWKRCDSLSTELIGHINNMVDEDHKEFKKRWFPYLQD